jgi:hypothetical protein
MEMVWPLCTGDGVVTAQPWVDCSTLAYELSHAFEAASGRIACQPDGIEIEPGEDCGYCTADDLVCMEIRAARRTFVWYRLHCLQSLTPKLEQHRHRLRCDASLRGFTSSVLHGLVNCRLESLPGTPLRNVLTWHPGPLFGACDNCEVCVTMVYLAWRTLAVELAALDFTAIAPLLTGDVYFRPS